MCACRSHDGSVADAQSKAAQIFRNTQLAQAAPGGDDDEEQEDVWLLSARGGNVHQCLAKREKQMEASREPTILL